LLADGAISRCLGERAEEPVKDSEPREGEPVVGAIKRLGEDIADATDHGAIIPSAALQSFCSRFARRSYKSRAGSRSRSFHRTQCPSPMVATGCWFFGAGKSHHVADTLDLTDDAAAALAKRLRQSIDYALYPYAPRLDPLKAILAKLVFLVWWLWPASNFLSRAGKPAEQATGSICRPPRRRAPPQSRRRSSHRVCRSDHRSLLRT
jgi:hypothetical protein